MLILRIIDAETEETSIFLPINLNVVAIMENLITIFKGGQFKFV